MPWQDLAACVGKTDLFFNARTVATAIAVCDSCDVRAECHQYAERHDIIDGVWGGQLRGIVHGSHTGYTRGCRCPSCRATKKRTSRNYYLRKHGDSTQRLTAAERQQLVELGLVDPLSEAG